MCSIHEFTPNKGYKTFTLESEGTTLIELLSGLNGES